jgi:hypothetical protein
MKLPIEKQSASPFNQMVELGVPLRIAKAVSQMLALPGTKTASRVVLAQAVKESSSMLCANMEEMLKVANPTAGKLIQKAIGLGMAEEEEEEDGLELALENVKVAYSVARNMGVPQERALMMAMYAHTRLMGG